MDLMKNFFIILLFSSTVIYSQDYIITWSDLTMDCNNNFTKVFEDSGKGQKVDITLENVCSYLGVLNYYKDRDFKISKTVVLPNRMDLITRKNQFQYMIWIEKNK